MDEAEIADERKMDEAIVENIQRRWWINETRC